MSEEASEMNEAKETLQQLKETQSLLDGLQQQLRDISERLTKQATDIAETKQAITLFRDGIIDRSWFEKNGMQLPETVFERIKKRHLPEDTRRQTGRTTRGLQKALEWDVFYIVPFLNMVDGYRSLVPGWKREL